jgi:hypothetical protein
MKISVFKDIKSVAPLKDTSAIKVLEGIRNGSYKTKIANIRIESDKAKRNQLKSKLPYATFSGVFTSRSNANLKASSGLACLDFDNVQNLEEIRQEINSDKYTFSSFQSPSGDGLKVLVKIPSVDNNNDYQDYYIELINHFQQYHELDKGTKDIARACYLSYDDELYLNNDSETFTDKFHRPLPVETKIVNIPITDKNEVAEMLEKWFKKKWTTTNRNNNLHAYARQMNAFGIDKSTCVEYLQRYDSGGKENEINKLIDSAYRYTKEFNTRSFEDKNTISEIKHLAIAGGNIDKLKNKIKGVDFEKVKEEFEKHKEDLKEDEYWFYTENDQIRLSKYRFKKYLEHNNIFKYYADSEKDAYHFVKNDKNFISLFQETKIKDFTLEDLESRGQYEPYELMAGTTSFFKREFLSMIKTKDVKVNRDTIDTSYVYYQNTAVKTTKDNIEVLKYSDIPDLIWENQVIKRDFKLKDESDGVFKTFLWKVSAENEDRYYTLKSVIGYLMHSYQNEGNQKSIIFNDEMISEDVPNGGSGKGLIHKAIGHIKNIVIEDGKKFDYKNQFAYQKVNKDTQILLLDDVPQHFDFKSLFSIVTSGMTVEKKGKDAYQIPFEESPKISIATNYTIKGDGDSHERRVFEVEIANYFNAKYTPQNEFGHLFFTEWDGEEWEKFDNFMIRCVQFFLKNGLVQSDKVNLEFRKFKNEMGPEFIEFMESQNFEGLKINKVEFRKNFEANYYQAAKFTSPQKFYSKLKSYCDFNDIQLRESKFNGANYFYFNEETEEEEETKCPF